MGYVEEPDTRLTREEALAIGARVAEQDVRGQVMTIAEPRRVDGRVVWIVSKGNVGAQWFVRVDDETGLAGPLQHWPGR